MNCTGCVHNYYEPDTNYAECLDPDYQESWETDCPHFYSQDDAEADAKYSHCDRY